MGQPCLHKGYTYCNNLWTSDFRLNWNLKVLSWWLLKTGYHTLIQLFQERLSVKKCMYWSCTILLVFSISQFLKVSILQHFRKFWENGIRCHGCIRHAVLSDFDEMLKFRKRLIANTHNTFRDCYIYCYSQSRNRCKEVRQHYSEQLVCRGLWCNS